MRNKANWPRATAPNKANFGVFGLEIGIKARGNANLEAIDFVISTKGRARTEKSGQGLDARFIRGEISPLRPVRLRSELALSAAEWGRLFGLQSK